MKKRRPYTLYWLTIAWIAASQAILSLNSFAQETPEQVEKNRQLSYKIGLKTAEDNCKISFFQKLSGKRKATVKPDGSFKCYEGTECIKRPGYEPNEFECTLECTPSTGGISGQYHDRLKTLFL